MPEPAWEMLAELMRARLAGQHLSVTSLALSSKSPMTTALRRIEDLIQGGLAARVPDPADRRRTLRRTHAGGHGAHAAVPGRLRPHGTRLPLKDRHG